MTSKKIKSNYIYNLIYQILLIIVPLIVSPYISRTLLADKIGQYSFSFSLISYFTIFASLGLGTYGQREIAKYKENIDAQSRCFWEIILCRLVSVIGALLINCVFILLNVYKEYSTLMIIMSINIFSIAFDIAFLFQGREDFKKIILLNSIVKVLGVIFIFIFVKKPDDLWIYTLIQSLTVFLGYFCIWFYLPKTLTRIKFISLKPFRHIKGTLILFLPTIAISIYTVLDRTLIGLIITDTYEIIKDGVIEIKKYSDLENGFYEQSEKIVKTAMTVITCIGTVMIPRNTIEFSNGNIEQVKNNVYSACRFVFFIGTPMLFGMIIIAPLFVPWFFGPGYEKCEILLSIFSLLTIIIGLSNVFGLQFLVPSGQDKKFAIALFIGAITNLVLNIFFIRLWWSIGAAIASIFAELIVTFIMGIIIRKDIDIMRIIKMAWKYLLSGIIMFVPLLFIRRFFSSSILDTIIVICIGVVIYSISLIVFKEPIMVEFIENMKNMYLNKKRKK